MDMNQFKQVTNIEYVGPHQIQSTSSPSMNFSVRIDPNVIVADSTQPKTGRTDSKPENRQKAF